MPLSGSASWLSQFLPLKNWEMSSTCCQVLGGTGQVVAELPS